MTDALALKEALEAEIPGAIVGADGSGRDATLVFKPEASRPILERLKRDGFNVLVDLTAADYSCYGENLPPAVIVKSPAPEGCRFKLTYRLMRLDTRDGLVSARVALHCWIRGDHGPASVKDLWPNADWLEREVWDMFGVKFEDRPGIKRLLLYEEFVGHPLRKDYRIDKRQPLIGPKDEKPRERMMEADLRPRVTP